MSLSIFVYLAGIVSDLKFLLFLLSIFFVIAGVLLAMTSTETDLPIKWAWWSGICTVFFAFVAVLLPSQKTMYLMAGAYGAQAVYESDSGQRIGKKVTDVIEKQLDELMKK